MAPCVYGGQQGRQQRGIRRRRLGGALISRAVSANCRPAERRPSRPVGGQLHRDVHIGEFAFDRLVAADDAAELAALLGVFHRHVQHARPAPISCAAVATTPNSDALATSAGLRPVAPTTNAFAGSTDSLRVRGGSLGRPAVPGPAAPTRSRSRSTARGTVGGSATVATNSPAASAADRSPIRLGCRAGRAPPQSIRRPDRERTTGPTARARPPDPPGAPRYRRILRHRRRGDALIGQRGPDLCGPARCHPVPRPVRRQGRRPPTARRRHYGEAAVVRRVRISSAPELFGQPSIRSAMMLGIAGARVDRATGGEQQPIGPGVGQFGVRARAVRAHSGCGATSRSLQNTLSPTTPHSSSRPGRVTVAEGVCAAGRPGP